MSTSRACHRTVLALPWLLNGSLEADERRQIREHLIACPQCRAELARTRETLALFGGAERRAAGTGATAAATATAAGESRSGKVLRPLAWAAAVALVVSSVTSLWLGSRDHGARSAAQPASRPAVAAAPVAQPAAPADVIFSTSFEGGSLASLPVAEAPAPPAKQRPVQAQSPVRIAVARAPQPPPNQISSVDFESGDLGQWQ